MARRSIQVYGLGQCPLDYLGKIEAYPPPDAKCEFSNLVIQGGGPAATALVALARWGLSCAFAGVVGDDPFGNTVKALLDEEGIDTSGILVRTGFESQFAFIVAEPGVGRRTIFWRRPTGPPLRPEELNFNIIRQAKVVHTDGLFVEASIAACRAAKDAGVPVVVDAGTLREGILELVPFSECFVVSENFARSLVGNDKPLDACYKLAESGPRLTAVTLGARGYVALADGQVIERPAYPVGAIDTTGCGDAFHAGLIYGVVKGWDVEKSLDFAGWAAAMVSLKLGGRASIPSLREVKEKFF